MSDYFSKTLNKQLQDLGCRGLDYYVEEDGHTHRKYAFSIGDFLADSGIAQDNCKILFSIKNRFVGEDDFTYYAKHALVDSEDQEGYIQEVVDYILANKEQPSQ